MPTIPTPITNYLSEPQARHAAHEDTWIGYYTADADKTNYRYLIGVYINAVRVSTLAIRPSVTNLVDGLYGVGYGNIRPVLGSYVPTDYFNPPAAGARTAITPYVEYYFTVGDNWTGASGEVCGTPIFYTGANSKAYNASRKYQDQVANVYYTSVNRGVFNKFQTARTSTDIRLSANDNFFMTAFYLDFEGYRLRQYQGDTLLSADNVSCTGDCIINFKNLAPGINANTTRFTVQLMRSFGGLTSDDVEYSFTLDCGNPKHTTRILHFMNRLGGFDTAYFTGATRKLISATRQRVTVDGSTLNTGSYQMQRKNSYNVLQGGARDYVAQSQEPYLLNTGFLTDADYQFYAEIITSPAVYLEETINGSTYFVPVTISQEKVEIRTRKVDGLTSLELEVVPGFINYSPSR